MPQPLPIFSLFFFLPTDWNSLFRLLYLQIRRSFIIVVMNDHVKSEDEFLKAKKNKQTNLRSGKEKMPTRLGEMMTDGLAILVLWNFLFILTCIPIITIGPAMAAMSFCTNSLVMDDRPQKGAAKLYFQAFKVSFAKALPLGICFLMVSVSFGTGFFVYSQLITENTVYMLMASVSLLVLLLFWGVAAHLYPLMFDFAKTDWENKKPVLVQKSLRQLFSEAGMAALTRMIQTVIGLVFSIFCLGLMVAFLPASIPLLLTVGFVAVGVATALAHTGSPY